MEKKSAQVVVYVEPSLRVKIDQARMKGPELSISAYVAYVLKQHLSVKSKRAA